MRSNSETEYVYVILHADYGVFNASHYEEKDEIKKGMYLPLELGSWTTYINESNSKFATEEEARAFTEWLMPGARAACQFIKIKRWIYCGNWW